MNFRWLGESLGESLGEVLDQLLHRFELELQTRTGTANSNWNCELFSLLSMLLLRSLISALQTGTANWNCEIKLELRIILIIVIAERHLVRNNFAGWRNGCELELELWT